MKFKIPDTPEELFGQVGKKLPNMNKWIPMFVVVALILFFGMTSFYSVEQDEVGVVRLFGKYVRTTDPGLHWKLPFNIEKMDKVKVARIFKEEFGFRTLQAGVKTKYSSRSFNEEALMLTGDLNLLDVSWVVQFKVKDPVALLFNVRKPSETVRDISEVVMRQVVGDSSVSEALTTRRVEINQLAEQKMQEILDSYGTGIDIVTVKLQDVGPPQRVQNSFNEVNQAKQEKERVINEAQKAKNKIIPEALGKAQKSIREAEAYQVSRVNRAKGDAQLFIDTWTAYKDAKEVTRKRLYLETLEKIIPRAGKIYVFEPQANNVLPLLNLSGSTK